MLEDKIGVLADAAKYDASCSTSGSARANTPAGKATAQAPYPRDQPMAAFPVTTPATTAASRPAPT